MNTISDMGYIIKEQPGAMRQSMIKKSHKHIIMINFDYRRRITRTPEDERKRLLEEDPDLLKRIEPKAFSSWLRDNKLLPPDFDYPEFNEDEIRKEHNKMEENPFEKITDHEDDLTPFEICIINKQNKGLIIDCVL